MVSCLFFSALLALHFDLRKPLTEPLPTRLECLLFNQALRVAINEASYALSQLASLALQDPPLLVLLLAIGVEALVELLSSSLRMGEQGTDLTPYREF
jgi:hypothetical protein